jgi:hypothetical protein
LQPGSIHIFLDVLCNSQYFPRGMCGLVQSVI